VCAVQSTKGVNVSMQQPHLMAERPDHARANRAIGASGLRPRKPSFQTIRGSLIKSVKIVGSRATVTPPPSATCWKGSVTLILEAGALSSADRGICRVDIATVKNDGLLHLFIWTEHREHTRRAHAKTTCEEHLQRALEEHIASSSTSSVMFIHVTDD
jgi:hypothetical protein